jgi:outer membrane protein assembly factor BamB
MAGVADATVVVLNKLTGETVWKGRMAGDSATGSESPARRPGAAGDAPNRPDGGSSATVSGTKDAALFTSEHFGMTDCSTPLHHDGMVFAASAYGAGGGLVKLSKDADGCVRAEEVYSTSEMENHHGGMVLIDGYLYGANGGNGGGALVCLEFQTGKVMWDQSVYIRDQDLLRCYNVAATDS